MTSTNPQPSVREALTAILSEAVDGSEFTTMSDDWIIRGVFLRKAREALALPDGGGSAREPALSDDGGDQCSLATETTANAETLDHLDPKRWEVTVHVAGTNVLTIGSHGYLAGYSDIDRFGDAVRAAAEHLQSFIGTGEPVECFACGGAGQERWMGANGEEVGPCSVCQPEDAA